MSARPARGPHHPAVSEIELPIVLHTVGDPTRFAIVRLLGERHSLACGQIAEALGLPLSTCSYHVRLLREAGLTGTEADGTEHSISLRRAELDERFPGLFSVLLGEQPPADS